VSATGIAGWKDYNLVVVGIEGENSFAPGKVSEGLGVSRGWDARKQQRGLVKPGKNLTGGKTSSFRRGVGEGARSKRGGMVVGWAQVIQRDSILRVKTQECLEKLSNEARNWARSRLEGVPNWAGASGGVRGMHVRYSVQLPLRKEMEVTQESAQHVQSPFYGKCVRVDWEKCC